MQRRKRGFTLVELSIVLVIIGLLIGGILVAQSMINTAKITSAIKQISQFDVGVENFKAKYRYLPGDAPAFGGGGDGLIDFEGIPGWCTPYGCPVQVFTGELANFWNNVDSTNYVSYAGGWNGPRAITSGTSRNVPLSKLGLPGSFFVASAVASPDPANADTANPRNVYAIMNASQLQLQTGGAYLFSATTSSNSAVTPVDLLALDQKIDDGIANAGNVLSGGVGNRFGGGFGGVTATPTAGICSLNTTYIVTHSGNECTPVIRIGISAGDPQ